MRLPIRRGDLVFSLLAIALLAGFAGPTIWLLIPPRRPGDRLLKSLREDICLDLKYYYFQFERLPRDCDEYFSTGYLPPWKDVMELIELGYNDSANGITIFDVPRRVYPQAVADSRPKIPLWREELERGREDFRNHEGGLRSQLQLYLDPKFRSTYSSQFFERLGAECGVSEDIVTEFSKVNIRLYMAHARANHLRDRVKESEILEFNYDVEVGVAAQALTRLKELRDEILEQAQTNQSDKPIDPDKKRRNHQRTKPKDHDQ